MRFKEIVETTSSGGFATVAMPMGSVQKRRKEQSIYEVDGPEFKYSNVKSKEDYLRMKKVLFDILKDPMSMSDPETKAIVQQYIIKLNNEADELGYR
jgi:hypothetical protein